jgi:hemin uptake protein HemP
MPEFSAPDRKRAADEVPSAAPTPEPGAAPRRVSSSVLFAGGRELAIDHNGRRYQLRITQSGKLILTA